MRLRAALLLCLRAGAPLALHLRHVRRPAVLCRVSCACLALCWDSGDVPSRREPCSCVQIERTVLLSSELFEDTLLSLAAVQLRHRTPTASACHLHVPPAMLRRLMPSAVLPPTWLALRPDLASNRHVPRCCGLSTPDLLTDGMICPGGASGSRRSRTTVRPITSRSPTPSWDAC